MSKQYDLYLGHNVPERNDWPVTDDELNEFLRLIRGDAPSIISEFLLREVPLESYTLIKAQGTWRDEREETTILRVIGEDKDLNIMRTIGKAYKARFGQEAVYLTVTDVEGELL